MKEYIEKVKEFFQKYPLAWGVLAGLVVLVIYFFRPGKTGAQKAFVSSDFAPIPSPVSGGSEGGGQAESGESLAGYFGGFMETLNQRLAIFASQQNAALEELAEVIESNTIQQPDIPTASIDPVNFAYTDLENGGINYTPSERAVLSASRDEDDPGPKYGYGGADYNELDSQGKRAMEKLIERNKTDADFRQSEIDRAQRVIKERTKAGMDTSEQEKYLSTLRSY